MPPFKVAAVEFNPGKEHHLEANIEGTLEMVREAAGEGARPLVLPEVAFCGIAADRIPFLDTVPGKATEAFAGAAGELDSYRGASQVEANSPGDVVICP